MPTLTEALREEFPEELSEIARWDEILVAAEREESLYARVRSYGTTVPADAAVLGVGLSAWPPSFYDRPVAAVLVHTSAPVAMAISPAGTREASSPVPPEAFSELELFQTAITAILDQGATPVPVIGVPRLSEQVAPGEETRCGASSATFGSRVYTSAGARAVLTAGHAAPIPNSSAYDGASGIVGRVTQSVRCASVLPRTTTPDIATIELVARVPDTVGVAPPSAGVAHAGYGDELTAYGAKTRGQKALVLAIVPRAAGPHPAGGDFGEAILTNCAISRAGDSGAPVYNAKGELVGHIVAGNSGVSVAQDVTYQLNAFNTTLR